MNDKKNIEDFFSQQFDGFEVRPSAGSFNQFMEKLEAAQEKKKRRSAFFLLAWGLAAAFLIVLGVSIYFDVKKPSPVSETTVGKPSTEQLTNLPNEATVPSTASPKHPALKSIKTRPTATPKSPAKNTIPGKSVVTNNGPQGKEPQETPPPIQNSLSGTVDPSPVAPPVFNPEVDPSPLVPAVLNPEEGPVGLANNVNPAGETAAPEVLQADYLNLLYGKPFSPLDLRLVSEDRLSKDLVRLQRLRHQPRFFIGVSYQAMLTAASYKENKNSNVDKTLYSEDFAGSYVRRREANKSTGTLFIPGIRFGLATEKVEIYASMGYYQLRERERVYFPEDSIVYTAGGSNGGSLTPLGSTGGGSNTATAAHASQFSELQDQGTYTNRFRYFYTSLGVSGVLHYPTFRVKPGIQVSYNRITRSEYVVVDAAGYRQVKGGTYYLNTSVFAFSLHCSFSKTIARGLELQLGPIYRMPVSSVFNSRYFATQNYKALGLEGALIYKFPAKLKN